MSLAPAEQERGTVKEPGSNHHEPHWSQSPPWFLELYQSRWEPGRAHTERKWAVSSFFLIPPRITSFQSLNQYCQRTAVHPTRNTLLTITLFREIITHAHTHVKIIYSLFFISQTRTIKGVLFFFFKKACFCPLRQKPVEEKPLFYKIGIRLPWIYKPKEKVLWQRPQTIEM